MDCTVVFAYVTLNVLSYTVSLSHLVPSASDAGADREADRINRSQSPPDKGGHDLALSLSLPPTVSAALFSFCHTPFHIPLKRRVKKSEGRHNNNMMHRKKPSILHPVYGIP